MGEEKIFKDLTKKYAELAKCIHSKDKRSPSLIKSCSKRIALLDKLRVLEVSYLKCLKNKVKKGQKGGVPNEGDEEKKQNGNQVLSNEDDADAIEAQNDNRQRALKVCTNTLEKGFNALDKGTYLTETAGNYIKENARNIIESSKGIDASEVKTKIEDAIKDLVDNATDMNADEARAYLNGASEKLADKVKQIYNNNKETTLEDIVNNIYEKGINLRAKVSPVLGKGLELGRESYEKAKGLLPSFFRTNQQQPTVGGKKTTYRLNGEKVLLLHKNKKVQRSIYVKDKGKTKYCKIDKEYVLLSKVKNKIQ